MKWLFVVVGFLFACFLLGICFKRFWEVEITDW